MEGRVLQAGQVSGPFLMTGFDEKRVHVIRHDRGADPVTLTIQVDPLGDGTWAEYGQIALGPDRPYEHHEFPAGFAAHWVCVKVDGTCQATVQFFYN